MNDDTVRLIYELEPYTARAALTMIWAAREAGIPLIIISGRRTEAQNARAGGAPTSAHLEGRAFDVAVAGYTRDQIPTWWWQALGEWAEQNLGLRWGGRFDWGGAPDINHFDTKTGLMT